MARVGRVLFLKVHVTMHNVRHQQIELNGFRKRAFLAKN